MTKSLMFPLFRSICPLTRKNITKTFGWYDIWPFGYKKHNMKNRTFLASVAMMFILINSCTKDSNSTNGQQQGTTDMSVSLTDGPGNYDKVNIDLQGVEVITEAEGTKTLDTKTGIYNLLDYSNGTDTVVATGTMKIGGISQIRLILGDNNTVVVDGVSYHLITPSAQESGLKLQLHDQLMAGVKYALTLDFDANQSIVQQGNGNYLLKPVIRVIDQAISGSIRGVVSPDTLHATIAAEGNGHTYSTSTNHSGEFLLRGIPAGTYTVTITPDSGSPKTIDNVTVTTGESTDLHTISF